jgi:hypothetical protein
MWLVPSIIMYISHTFRLAAQKWSTELPIEKNYCPAFTG